MHYYIPGAIRETADAAVNKIDGLCSHKVYILEQTETINQIIKYIIYNMLGSYM